MDWGWIAPLADKFGIGGATLLIFAAGISWKFDKILSVIRGIIKDWREQNRLDRELQARIERESGIRRAQIERIKAGRSNQR